MSNNAAKIVDEIDEITEGFKRVPVVELPPKVKWGEIFKSWDDQKKIDYLMKFAEAMNHAAATIQTERDDLGKLCEKKEQQLEQMNDALIANNAMIQQEVTSMNEYKQEVNKSIAQLNAKIKELERGDHN